MGLIKPNNYSKNELKFDAVSKAVSHPAHSRIIDLLVDYTFVRNIDLSGYLNLSHSMVTKHLDYLKRAGVIYCEYQIHYDILRLNQETLDYYFSEVEKWKEGKRRLK
ncbi:helix-turn-helix transcriptional regulator [Fluviicola sp.]|uniref:helix-turn-helix transcriptional regulator n=1 Tax=Fluviicola sp. TaxID=1917219 RepID=UPI00262BCE8D|nr:helix-turn-helix transcriptional regulator [Fluviicola sp.]